MRARGWLPWVALGVVGAVAVVVGLLFGDRETAVPVRAAPSSTHPSSAASPSARSLPYSLLTHCGIDEARIDQTYYEADHPLVGPGTPPPGWATPYQSGTMTLLGPTRAVFRDDVGHEIWFHARVGATAFKQLCD